MTAKGTTTEASWRSETGSTSLLAANERTSPHPKDASNTSMSGKTIKRNVSRSDQTPMPPPHPFHIQIV
jgi:hypothetical protein